VKKPRTTPPRKPPPEPLSSVADPLSRRLSNTRPPSSRNCGVRMAAGETTLPQICRDAHMPNRWTVYNWAQRKPEFLEKFDIAREQLCEYWADELLDISDNSGNDWVRREHGVVLDAEHIQRSRLRVDSRKWLLSKLAHTKYGDRMLAQTQQLDANDKPITPELVVVIGHEKARAIGWELEDRV